MIASARTRLLRCSGLLLGIALPAYAQQDAAEIVKIDKIEVTGSHIKRVDIETGLPLEEAFWLEPPLPELLMIDIWPPLPPEEED